MYKNWPWETISLRVKEPKLSKAFYFTKQNVYNISKNKMFTTALGLSFLLKILNATLKFYTLAADVTFLLCGIVAMK